MKTCTKLAFLAFSLLLLQGCATMADSIAAKGTGEYRIYDNSFDEVWDATISVVTGSKLSLVTQNKQSGEILAQQGISAFSYGENVAVFIERKGSEVRTRVEVVSKKAMATNVFAKNWEEEILEKLDLRLNVDMTNQ